ncbi:MAG: polysaccharide biosynthesis/export family protein [Gammaproteobacteria bacterium]
MVLLISKHFLKLICLMLMVSSIQVFAYNISSGDVLHLEVFGEPELNLDVTVDSSGFIEYPFAGRVSVEGKEVGDVKGEIVTLLKDGYFINPQVTVVVKEFKPFFIQGEVKSPGSYPFEPGLTVRKAVALAGGFTERANKKKIYITEAGEDESSERKISLDESIASGDIIIVKESFF